VVGSPRQQVRRFRDHLAALGVNATIRVTRGAEIDAACGQLAAAGRGKAPADAQTKTEAEAEAEAETAAQAVRLVPGARSR
jgi:23S rRNA (adenine2503-C2)-methyltransferase